LSHLRIFSCHDFLWVAKWLVNMWTYCGSFPTFMNWCVEG
jgi:hypothetical protein